MDAIVISEYLQEYLKNEPSSKDKAENSSHDLKCLDRINLRHIRSWFWITDRL